MGESDQIVSVFSTRPTDREFLERANGEYGLNLQFLETKLNEQTVHLAHGATAIAAFVNDLLNRAVLTKLAEGKTKVVALRCAGSNNVDLLAARELGLKVVRVPAYSPHAVAEHTLAMILALNRKLYRSYNRVREGNFSLEGLLGFDLYQKTVGIIGTGKIGSTFAGLMSGFGCRLIAFDPTPDPKLAVKGVGYVPLDQLLQISDIVTLHCPLTQENRHMINEPAISQMKPGVMLINTGRGGLIDTRAVIKGLKSQKIGYLGLDVYEEEAPLFFEDRSDAVISDDVFMRLLTFPNVLITGHQAYFTREALAQIASTTLKNINDAFAGRQLENEVTIG